MERVEKSIEVKCPVRTVYNQWTQFEEFPQFMTGVKEVKQLDDTHMHWHEERMPGIPMDIQYERNLYLATQLIELNVPLVLAFNMSDIAEQRGLSFDIEQLSKLLEAPIVHTIGNKAKGKTELLEAIRQIVEQRRERHPHIVHYGDEIEEEIEKIEPVIAKHEPRLGERYGARWLALKLIEQDSNVAEKISSPEVLRAADASVGHLRDIFGDEPEIVIADRRYGFMFKPRVCIDSESAKGLLTMIFGLDGKSKITIMDMSGIPFGPIGLISAPPPPSRSDCRSASRIPISFRNPSSRARNASSFARSSFCCIVMMFR